MRPLFSTPFVFEYIYFEAKHHLGVKVQWWVQRWLTYIHAKFGTVRFIPLNMKTYPTEKWKKKVKFRVQPRTQPTSDIGLLLVRDRCEGC